MNRHGWTTGSSVAWNVNVTSGMLEVQSPPGNFNLAVGCNGKIAPASSKASFSSIAMPVEPRSLFRSQLAARIGEDKVALVLEDGDAPAPATVKPISAARSSPNAKANKPLRKRCNRKRLDSSR